MFCALVRSMDIVLTNKPCCGQSLVCGRLLNSSAGATLSLVPAITWSWHARWSPVSFILGKATSGNRLLNRCVAGCTNCCHSWARLLVPHNPAENRLGEQKGRQSARPSAFQSCGRRQNQRNWCRSSRLTRCLIVLGPFHGTPSEVLAGAVSLNKNCKVSSIK